jgi:hypothetical protein
MEEKTIPHIRHAHEGRHPRAYFLSSKSHLIVQKIKKQTRKLVDARLRGHDGFFISVSKYSTIMNVPLSSATFAALAESDAQFARGERVPENIIRNFWHSQGL